MKEYSLPEDRLYSDTHEWILIDDGVGTVGITDYAQDKLGDIVYVELPQEGVEVSRGDKVGEIESVKTVAEIFSPVSGKIIEVNKALEDKPEIINEDPYNDGWIYKIELTNKEETNTLLDSAKYKELIEHE